MKTDYKIGDAVRLSKGSKVLWVVYKITKTSICLKSNKSGTVKEFSFTDLAERIR